MGVIILYMSKSYSGPNRIIKPDTASMIEDEITRLINELQEAEKAGNTRAVKKLKEKLISLQLWLDGV